MHYPSCQCSDVTHIDRLHEQLACLSPRVPRMRAALAGVWRAFLWSSLYGKSYLGEDPEGGGVNGGGDAFEAFVAVLKQRARYNYTTPPLVRYRMEHREKFFPCLVCNTTGSCGTPTPHVEGYGHGDAHVAAGGPALASSQLALRMAGGSGHRRRRHKRRRGRARMLS